MSNVSEKKYRFDSAKHVHLLNEKPLKGTTTIIKEVLSPMLSWYGSSKALEKMGWTNPNPKNDNYVPREEGIEKTEEFLNSEFSSKVLETPETWYDFLQECYRNHDAYKREKGTWGKQTHFAIEKAVKQAISDNEGYLRIESYENEAVGRFASWGRGKKFIYSEVHIFSELLWLGGILDLVYKENGEYYLADAKTGKKIYESVFIQLGMYDCQQGESGYFTKDGEKIGEPLEIKGYTAVNIPKEGGIAIKTYRGTQQLRELTVSLMGLYNTLQDIKTICQKN